jgi:nucleoside-diphosphate-sugar epimerase
MSIQNVAVVGGSGFVGSAIMRHGSELTRFGVCGPRLSAAFGSDPFDSIYEYQKLPVFGNLVRKLAGADAVIVAAGLAKPTSKKTAELWGANAVLPAFVALAACEAGAGRVVHVSSAAALGDGEELHEMRETEPLTHYGRSKAVGESCFSIAAGVGISHCIYRPGSIVGMGRPIFESIRRVLCSDFLFLPASGTARLPVASVDRVAAACLFLVETPEIQMALHPWEGVTSASLATAMGRSKPIRSLPEPIVGLLRLGLRPMVRLPGLGAHARRIQLLCFGQRQVSTMEAKGFLIKEETPGNFIRCVPEIEL